MSGLTFDQIKQNEEIKAYIQNADLALKELGFTEHSFAHVTRCAKGASDILHVLGYSDRDCELARIAGYLHDIGNVINRVDHAQSGAVMAFRILDKLGMDANETAQIICAIGNHDESTGVAVNAISAALILADKSDVRRTRVRNTEISTFDIHDRVNYAVEASSLSLDPEKHTITLHLKIDTEISSVMDYFEIFLNRMLLCRKAADYLNLRFHLKMNDSNML